jgi:hypothetical protein
MKISGEEIFAAVRMNDALADVSQDLFQGVASMGVDMESAQYVAMQRGRMLLMASPEIPATIGAASALASCWLDGFCAALHAIEQQNLTQSP